MSKSIICVETNKTYGSINDAARELGITPCNITNMLKGRQKTARGFTFQYAETETRDDHIIAVQKPAIVKGKGKRTNGNTKPVFCISDGNFFTSCTDAAEEYDASQSNVSCVCNGDRHTANGKRFCYVKDLPMHLEEISKAIQKANLCDELLAREANRKRLKAIMADIEGDIARLSDELSQKYRELESVKEALMDID